jgi:AraC-like DNA-binding protein/DNA-binding CsgD family transcriptional regulator
MWFRFGYAELSLPATAIHSAADGLAASPLYDLFQAHVLNLRRFFDEANPASAAESLGSATLELASAVIATVGQGDLARNDVANEALVARIEAYVQQHLADPALSPERIAYAHHISVRQLYKLWSERDLGLAEWIMRGRLEGAGHDIANRGSLGIAAVARQWGFTDPAHFGRRFRAAYGLSPREWRQAQDHQEDFRTAAPFLLHPAPALLEPQRTGHPGLVSQILDLLAGPPGGHRGVAPQGLAEPLTDSDIRVLRYLPIHLTAHKIAAELSISVHTVTTHMRHLYATLGVHRRREAVARARDLGLLAPRSGSQPTTDVTRTM